MTEWKTYRLGDIATMKYGKLPPKSNSGRYPIWSGYRNVGLTDTYNCGKGTIIVVARGVGGTGDVKMAKEDCFLKNLSIAVNLDVNICNSQFFYYKFLLSNLKYLDSGSAQSQITIDDLKRLQLSLPSLEEQRRIAGILGAIDDKIENNRRINDNLEQQAQALYKQWFVDFEFPNEEGKPYKSSGGKMVDSELGLIPEGWSVGKLEDVGTIVGGGTPSKAKQEYYTSNGIAWITPKDLSITHAKFTAKGEVDITDIGYANSSAKMMPRGSILFSSRAPIGYISIAKNDICTNQGFKSVVPNNGCTAFVYYFLLSNTENIESKATGSTFKEASGALMKSLELVIPSDDILEKFEKIMSPIFESQEKFEAENETLAMLRDTLLPKLMNGEIKL